ncbi:MAG: DUF1194 domain-containing protein [Pseudomonadota bacterium]
MIRRAVLAALMVLSADQAHAACRQALALALDVSGSVDAREYRLQMGGIAAALDSPEVRGKLMSLPSTPVRLLIFEWSGPTDQAVVVPWVEIDSDETLDVVIQTLRGAERRNASPGTALGIAMREGARHLAGQADCWKRTLDVSGDGKSNLGPRPAEIKAELEGQGITINGLVIGIDDPTIGDVRQAEIGELSAYFTNDVIMGPGAFVQTALGFSDYARAMQKKLLRELDGLVFSQR